MVLKGVHEVTIDRVVRKRLCTSCGTCAGVCGTSAIAMHLNRFGVYVPAINQELCTRCGLCVRVCPGHGFNYSEQYHRIFGSLPDHVALGACLGSYVGHTADTEVLHRSQSGGLVSTIVLYCLEKGLSDGAVVTRWRPDCPLEPQTHIARTREEVLAAVGSKYFPVPASQTIRTVLHEPGRFVFVGTPCQIHGMRKAEEACSRLADKIALYVGLHCVGVFTFHFHDQILHKVGIKRSDVVDFRHRDKTSEGWPGKMHLEGPKGHIQELDAKNSKLWPRAYFTNWRCLLCFDKANEFSDISCGDCRVPEAHQYFQDRGYDLREGLSEFVVRSARAQQVISQMVEEGRLIVRQVDADSIARSIGVAGKKLGLNTFSTIARLFGAGVPEYGIRFRYPRTETSWKDKVLHLWTLISSSRYYFAFVLGRYALARWILKRIPHKVLGKLDARCSRRTEWIRFGFVTELTAVTAKDGQDVHRETRGQ